MTYENIQFFQWLSYESISSNTAKIVQANIQMVDLSVGNK